MGEYRWSTHVKCAGLLPWVYLSQRAGISRYKSGAWRRRASGVYICPFFVANSFSGLVTTAEHLSLVIHSPNRLWCYDRSHRISVDKHNIPIYSKPTQIEYSQGVTVTPLPKKETVTKF